jgi:uncharacterized CHY-type Zn-finger protein
MTDIQEDDEDDVELYDDLEEYGSDGHCCPMMNLYLNDSPVVKYDPKHREYRILVGKSRTGKREYDNINNCPWCGTLFAPSLREVLPEVLKQEGLEHRQRLPKEFKSDEWWRNRGL